MTDNDMRLKWNKSPFKPHGAFNLQMWHLRSNPNWVIIEQMPESGGASRYFACNDVSGSASPRFSTWKDANDWLTGRI